MNPRLPEHHSVTWALTYPTAGGKKGESLIGRGTARQPGGRPVRRQNKSALSFSVVLSLRFVSSPVVVVNVVVVVVFIDLEFDLNTSYLNYLVFVTSCLLVYF